MSISVRQRIEKGNSKCVMKIKGKRLKKITLEKKRYLSIMVDKFRLFFLNKKEKNSKNNF